MTRDWRHRLLTTAIGWAFAAKESLLLITGISKEADEFSRITNEEIASPIAIKYVG